MKLKNINRGLVLGGVLILGTVIYVVNDYQTFKKSKPEITQRVNEIFDGISTINNSGKDNIRKNATDFVVENYTDYSSDWNSNFWGATKSERLQELTGKNVFSKGEILDFELNIDSMEISKWGDGAQVSITYSMYIEVLGGEVEYFGMGWVEPIAGRWNYDEYNVPENIDEMKFKENITDGNATVYLLNENGSWKIAGIQGYGYCSNGVVPVDVEDVPEIEDISDNSDNSEEIPEIPEDDTQSEENSENPEDDTQSEEIPENPEDINPLDSTPDGEEAGSDGE